jgi:hypothetical protein
VRIAPAVLDESAGDAVERGGGNCYRWSYGTMQAV